MIAPLSPPPSRGRGKERENYFKLIGAKMTKTDIVEKISEKCAIKKRESSDMVELVFSILKSTLEDGEDIKISGFGKFEVKKKRARKGRNPQTGETITIDARSVLTFKPSTILKSAVNSG